MKALMRHLMNRCAKDFPIVIPSGSKAEKRDEGVVSGKKRRKKIKTENGSGEQGGMWK